ncbi:uncharacterized protein LOC111640239 [Centruroides sculpturatus]|uniref:uncharacterized protein LOC111640239 n=1 Tax=Centruroides sculpturatus TaxID=218467 RepID=UPI000C6E5B13|nr:uncharacterized protein LOC111640239 [Centruroides sculpturatus]
MSNVEEEGRFDLDEVILANEDGKSVVVSRTSLIEKGGLLKHFIIVCPNEGKFILRLPVTLEMLHQFARFLNDELLSFPYADDGFQMYLICKQYFINELQEIYFNTCITWMYFHRACHIHDLSCRHNEKQLQYHCWKHFSLSEKSLFSRDDFQLCEETTVHKLMTCPVYVSLDELDLFHGLSMWIEKTFVKLRAKNGSISKRDVIKPFLSFIRYFVIESEHLTRIVNDCHEEQTLTEEEVQSIRRYITQKNVAILPEIVSANVIPRRLSDYFSFIAKNPVTEEILENEETMEADFRFMADIWVHEKCFLDEIKLPLTYNKTQRIKVFVGVKSTYTQDFVYEQSTCYNNGIVVLKKAKLLSKRSFYIFSVRIPKEVIDSTSITVLQKVQGYVPIYDFLDTITRRKDKKTKFSCTLCLCF